MPMMNIKEIEQLTEQAIISNEKKKFIYICCNLFFIYFLFLFTSS
jgi:hypothetical protein